MVRRKLRFKVNARTHTQYLSKILEHPVGISIICRSSMTSSKGASAAWYHAVEVLKRREEQ